VSSEETVNLREAARLSGVPLPTLRRRLQKGEVEGCKVPGPFGSQWEVRKSELQRLRGDLEPTLINRSATPINVIGLPDQCDQPSVAEQVAPGQDASYWRGRWEELREVLDHLEKVARPAPPVQDRETEGLEEALRQKSRELAQARNLVDNLRREKARLESEVQALRERIRAAETTQVDLESAPGLRTASGGAWRA